METAINIGYGEKCYMDMFSSSSFLPHLQLHIITVVFLTDMLVAY